MSVNAAAVWIVLREQIVQFFRVIVRDLLIAPLPNQNRRVVAKINQRVAECIRPQFPGGPTVSDSPSTPG